MKKALLLLLLSFSITAQAQSASHEAAARDFLEASNARQALESTYDRVLPQMQSMFEQWEISDEQRPVLDRYIAKMVQAMREELSWEKMEPQLIAVYTKVYSERELAELAEFYRSPLGRKFVSKTPELMQASMQMVQEMMPAFMLRIQEIEQELRAELAKPAAPAAGSS